MILFGFAVVLFCLWYFLCLVCYVTLLFVDRQMKEFLQNLATKRKRGNV